MHIFFKLFHIKKIVEIQNGFQARFQVQYQKNAHSVIPFSALKITQRGDRFYDKALTNLSIIPQVLVKNISLV